jgi:hypothetical protein
VLLLPQLLLLAVLLQVLLAPLLSTLVWLVLPAVLLGQVLLLLGLPAPVLVLLQALALA